MSPAAEQEQYIALYFDLEKIKTQIALAHQNIVEGLDSIASVYVVENEALISGKKPVQRADLDIATRAAIAASAAMLFPQLRQLTMAVDYAQKACSMLCPSLQKSSSVPQ
jgi:hypothetical protein